MVNNIVGFSNARLHLNDKNLSHNVYLYNLKIGLDVCEKIVFIFTVGVYYNASIYL